MIALKAISRVNAAGFPTAVEAERELRVTSLKRTDVLASDFFRRDDQHLVGIEAYDSSETLIAHIEGGSIDKLFSVSEVLEVEIFGDPTPELRSRFAQLANVTIDPSITHSG